MQFPVQLLHICSQFTTYSVPKETEVHTTPHPSLCFINQDHNDYDDGNGDDDDDDDDNDDENYSVL